MEVTAKAKHIRMSPRKVRLIAGLIRGMEVNSALDQLQATTKWAKKPVKKLLDSVVSNAVNNFELDKDNLFIKEIRVDGGVMLKRWMPRAHGRATPLRKRASHIIIILEEIKPSGDKKPRQVKVEAPVKIDGKVKEPGEIKVEKKDKAGEAKRGAEKEVSKEIHDPRQEGRGGHTKIEGSSQKGFASKVFRRKVG